MVNSITLIVLRCRDLPASRHFYEALGIAFTADRHGTGPDHWSGRIGETVLELYPAGAAAPSIGRLGFRIDDVETATSAVLAAGGRIDRAFDAARGSSVVVDPDGTKIELVGDAAATTTSPSRWSVWRQDDNGQRFRISSGHSRVDAERACAEFEAKGHKQLYWVSPDDAGGDVTGSPQ